MIDLERKSSKLSDDFYWKENFEDFQTSNAQKYHDGVMKYSFNTLLYDVLLKDIFQRYLPKRKLKMLDAGGGTGKWAEFFCQQGHDVTLFDNSKAMLQVAHNNFQEKEFCKEIEIIQGDICNMPFNDNTFDFVLCDRNPISHCGKQKESYQAISEIHRVLQPGGIIIASVLNKYRKITQLVMELQFEKAKALFKESYMQRADNQYTYYFTSQELQKVLEDTKFQNINLFPTTALAEYIPTAWLLSETALKPLLELEQMIRNKNEMLDSGVRYHFVATK